MSHRWRVCALLVPFGLVSACVQGDIYSGDEGSAAGGSISGSGCGQHCHLSAVAAGAGAGTAGAGASGTGHSTTTTTTTSGSGHGATTGAVKLPTPDCASFSATDGGACPNGMVQLSGTVLTLGMGESGGISEAPVGNVPVGALGCSVPLGATDDDGGFFLCTSSNTPISATFISPEYVPATMAEVSVSSSLAFGDVIVIGLFLDTLIGGMAPNLNTDAGAIFAVVHSISGKPPCAPLADAGAAAADAGLPDYSGWVFSATYLDGTSGPWSVGYLGSAGIQPGATATGVAGIALIYNISTSLEELKVTATPPAALASQCAVENGNLGFTGNVYALPGQFGYFPALIP